MAKGYCCRRLTWKRWSSEPGMSGWSLVVDQLRPFPGDVVGAARGLRGGANWHGGQQDELDGSEDARPHGSTPTSDDDWWKPVTASYADMGKVGKAKWASHE